MLNFISAWTNTKVVNAADEQREAYFNGSVYIRLAQPMTLWRHSALSFRTCRGEFYFYYQEKVFSLKLEKNRFNQIKISFKDVACI